LQLCQSRQGNKQLHFRSWFQKVYQLCVHCAECHSCSP
jgi:hypothetical protein